MEFNPGFDTNFHASSTVRTDHHGFLRDDSVLDYQFELDPSVANYQGARYFNPNTGEPLTIPVTDADLFALAHAQAFALPQSLQPSVTFQPEFPQQEFVPLQPENVLTHWRRPSSPPVIATDKLRTERDEYNAAAVVSVNPHVLQLRREVDEDTREFVRAILHPSSLTPTERRDLISRIAARAPFAISNNDSAFTRASGSGLMAVYRRILLHNSLKALPPAPARAPRRKVGPAARYEPYKAQSSSTSRGSTRSSSRRHQPYPSPVSASQDDAMDEDEVVCLTPNSGLGADMERIHFNDDQLNEIANLAADFPIFEGDTFALWEARSMSQPGSLDMEAFSPSTSMQSMTAVDEEEEDQDDEGCSSEEEFTHLEESECDDSEDEWRPASPRPTPPSSKPKRQAARPSAVATSTPKSKKPAKAPRPSKASSTAKSDKIRSPEALAKAAIANLTIAAMSSPGLPYRISNLIESGIFGCSFDEGDCPVCPMFDPSGPPNHQAAMRRHFKNHQMHFARYYLSAIMDYNTARVDPRVREKVIMFFLLSTRLMSESAGAIQDPQEKDALLTQIAAFVEAQKDFDIQSITAKNDGGVLYRTGLFPPPKNATDATQLLKASQHESLMTVLGLKQFTLLAKHAVIEAVESTNLVCHCKPMDAFSRSDALRRHIRKKTGNLTRYDTKCGWMKYPHNDRRCIDGIKSATDLRKERLAARG